MSKDAEVELFLSDWLDDSNTDEPSLAEKLKHLSEEDFTVVWLKLTEAFNDKKNMLKVTLTPEQREILLMKERLLDEESHLRPYREKRF